MKLNEVITENAFTDFAKRQAYNLVGQQSDWGRQGLELQTKKNFITKVEQLLLMNIKSAGVAGNTPDPSYVKKLVVGYLKKNGINIPLQPAQQQTTTPATTATQPVPESTGSPTAYYWEEQIDRLAPGVASNNSKAITQMANLIYQIISSESETQPNVTLGGGSSSASAPTPSPAPTPPDNDTTAIIKMIRKLASQGNTTGLQTIANAANRSLSRIAKQNVAQTPQAPQNIPVSIGGNQISPGHPSYAAAQAAAQAAQPVPESKNPVQSWIKGE
jgi:hypothetical protein